MTSIDTGQPAVVRTKVVYPESDGQPLGETDYHIEAILYLRQALRHLFRNTAEVYVAANMFLYYEEGDPAKQVAPDVFVVEGVSKEQRRTFKTWEEEAVPSLVVEVTSKSSRLEDQGTKRALYEMLGVEYYVLFDPLEEYLVPPLQVFRLTENGYIKVVPEDGEFAVPELDVVLKREKELLRVVDSDTGAPVPTLDELVKIAQREADKARQEAARAEKEAARAEHEANRAEEAAVRAEQEAARADQEANRADRLEREVERLRKRLADSE